MRAKTTFRRKGTVEERLRYRMKIEGECWLLPIAKGARYAYIKIGGKKRLAHRVMYELLVGPIPEGTELDHTCRRGGCINPAHLEPVTHRENMARSPYHDIDACRRAGHPYTPENTYRRPDGWRECRRCRYERRPVHRKEWG